MIIYPAEIIEQGEYAILKIVFETDGKEQALWYKLASQYKEFFVTENQDAAVVALLPLAMKNNENIAVKGQISARLHYTLISYLIPALNFTDNDYHIITINAENLNFKRLNEGCFKVATGISCGIDSLSTIATHKKEDKKEYALNYLTYFKAGAHGVFEGRLSEIAFAKGLENAKLYAREVNLPIIVIESNIGEVVRINFQKLHSILQLSCVLTIQKAISVYYYASAYRFDYFNLSNKDTSGWDIVLIQYLQTESLSFFSSVVQYTRLKRTEIISEEPSTYKHLDVCTNSFSAIKINCSQCSKCMRTQLTLELLGKLKLYDKVFNLDVYEFNKDYYIAELLFRDKLDQIDKELLSLLKKKKNIELIHYFIGFRIRIRNRINKNKKKLKVLLFNKS
ncbi:hypothetical protein [Pseudotamlana agarivorans]|uniref:hypothetical protein n=1 Tax=Pseudotamlana agarivorans TaxID=481183 RepID=UPI000833B7E1|nr:hypothetical protein [Tamlana agarivorans]